MSYNHSRSDRSETQYQRTGRSAAYHQQQRSSSGGYGKGAGAGSAPAPSPSGNSSSSSVSSNRSLKKSSNAQGGQSRVNFPPVDHSVSKDSALPPKNQNGSHVQSRSQGMPDAPPVFGGSTNPTESSSASRSTRAIPKAPTSQSTTMSPEGNVPSTPAMVSGDTPKAFAFKFGSLPDLMQIPARTSSAPPNLDEQKRAQAHQDSLRLAPNLPTPAPKKDAPNKAAHHQPTDKEAHESSREQRDVQVPYKPPSNQTQRSPIVHNRMPTMQTPYQHPQVPQPVQFGGPNMHVQPQNVTPTSFQMPMPMSLPMGNAPHLQQQVYLPGLQSHPMPHQGMMHQAQGLSYPSPMSAQLLPQLGHMGVGLSSQYPQQQGGNFGGPRRTTPVKITHPDTHEELKLDRRADPNVPSRSQAASSFTRPINYTQSSYNASSVPYSPVSVPSNNSQMGPNYQVPRFNLPVSQGSLSAHSSAQLIRPIASAQSVSDSSHATDARDSQNVALAAPPVATKVTVKPAAAVEKLGSPKALRPSGEGSISHPCKTVESDMMRPPQQLEPGHVSRTNSSCAPQTASSVDNVAVVSEKESQQGEINNKLNSSKDYQKPTGKKESAHPLPEDLGQTTPEPQTSELSLPSSCVTAQIVDAKEIPSSRAINGFREELGDSTGSSISDSKADKLLQGSTHTSSKILSSFLQDNRLKCDSQATGVEGDQSVSEKRAEISEISPEKQNPRSLVDGDTDLSMSMSNSRAPSNGTARGRVEGSPSLCLSSETLADVLGNSSSVLSLSVDLQSSGVPLDLSRPLSGHIGAKNAGNGSTHVPGSVSKDNSASELNVMRSTTSRAKKKKKEILQKADAAGITSDLYMAYKGPEEKKEIAVPSESAGVSLAATAAVKQEGAATHGQADAEATKEVEQIKNEPEDWEDAADVSTPKLDTVDPTGHPIRGSSDDVKDGCKNLKKYSRDFLLKFAVQYTTRPVGLEISSDIVDLFGNANMGASHLDPYATPGRVMDRPGSASRVDRRPSNVVDDRWMRSSSFGSGHGGNLGFRPGQGGNSGVLRNPRVQAPIMSRPIQPMGSLGGGGRNSPDSERWQRASNFQQKGLIPSPHTPSQVMHKAEKKYEVGKVTSEEEAKQRQLKGILNKLTPQNFEKLFEQVKGVGIDNAVTLTGVISQIFDKALMEPTFCQMYADFCLHLSGELPNFNENGKNITFRRLLLDKCQEEFERGEREEEEANRAEEGEVKQSEEEREEKRLKARRRMLGNIRLIGELYKKGMLTEKIMHECIKKLLGYDQDPDEENIEALCKLMSTIGEMIDYPRAKARIDSYFGKMTKLSDKKELSSRVRFMLKDTIDLRKNKWQQRRKVEGPKKIEEVHRDAAQERQIQASRLTRGPSINPSARKGPAEFGPRGGMLSSPNPQMSSFRGSPQVRGFGNQDVRVEGRPPYEARTVPMPQRSLGNESITLGPQGGLGQGMSIRRPAVALSPLHSDISPATGELRRAPVGSNGFGPYRPASPVAYGSSSAQERGTTYGNQELGISGRGSDPSFGASSTMRGQGSTLAENVASENVLPEERLRGMSMAAIKEFYSARDEKEVGLCIKDLNSPGFHPTMISLWVTDSFERKDVERDLLATLLINLVKTQDGTLSEVQLVKGFETVLTTLEDAVNDAPRAGEFLGRILGKAITEKVVSLAEIGRLIREGGEEPGSLLELGLGGDVLGSALETIKAQAGEASFDEIRQSSGLRLEEFKPRQPNRSKILEKFT